MPQHKVTMSFGPAVPIPSEGRALSTTGDLHGWTESWYRDQDETDELALGVSTALATLRRICLTSGWRIVTVRVSRFPGSRAAARFNFSPRDGRGRYIGTGSTINPSADEQPYDCLVVNVASASGRQRAFSMRGIGSEVVSAGSIYMAPPNFVEAFNLYKTELTAFYNLKIRTVADQAVLSNVVLAPFGGVPASPVAPLLLSRTTLGVFGDRVVKVSGVLGMSGINGFWRLAERPELVTVAGVEYYAAQLRQKRGRTVLGVYSQGGSAQTFTETLSRITSVSPAYGSSRRTGSFSTRPRGRRSTRQS